MRKQLVIVAAMAILLAFGGRFVAQPTKTDADPIRTAAAKSLTLLSDAGHNFTDAFALLLAAFSWPFSARTIRSQVLSLRERGYVDLARVSGLGNMAIIFQEILPNLLPFLGVGLAVSTVGAILAEVGLELIGLGPGNVATLGLMINWAIGWGAMSLGKWHLIAAPAGILVLLFFSLNFSR